MKSRRIFLILGCAILALFVVMAIAPGIFTPYGLKDMWKPWLKPSGEHFFGTNNLGYDIYTEIVYGARQTLIIAGLCSVISLSLGVLIGILSTVKGPVGVIFNGIINVWALLPRLIVLIVLAGFLGNNMSTLVMLVSGFMWVGVARNVRVKIQSINRMPFMENLRILGFSKAHIMFFHVIPNLFDIIITGFLLNVTGCIMMESTLGFLGFGDLYNPSWGVMMNLAYKRGAIIRGAYNYLLMPGVCIMLVSLAFYFVSRYFESKADVINTKQ